MWLVCVPWPPMRILFDSPAFTRITDIDIVIASRKLAAGMDPSAMLPVPVLALSAKAPYAVLLLPLGLLRRALTLIAVLSSPMSLLRSGLSVDCNVCLLRGRNDSSRMWQKHHESKYEYDRNR